MVVFNSTLFNKAIFNTKFIASGGVPNRKFRKLPKELLWSHALLKVKSKIIMPVSIRTEGKILTEFNSKVGSKISYTDNVITSSKILSELYKPVTSIVYTDMEVDVNSTLDNMELKLNKIYKYNTIKSVLSLLDI
tara:strand:+ start:1371 stop:1775 length:405 start_codon:yes stop_codon:yes gene_type:complete